MKKAILILLVIAMIIPMGLTGCTNHRGGQLIIGNTTELAGDFGEAQWQNNAADADIRELINGYSPVALTRQAEYVYNDKVATVTQDVYKRQSQR